MRYPRDQWTIKASASYPNHNIVDHHVSNILDNQIGNYLVTFASLLGKYHWFQIDFGETINEITYVEFFKRAHNGQRFKDVTIRIGNVDWSEVGGLRPIDVNKQCGWAGSPPSGTFQLWFKCFSSMTGRYLSAQSSAHTYLEADEVFIHSIMTFYLYLICLIQLSCLGGLVQLPAGSAVYGFCGK